MEDPEDPFKPRKSISRSPGMESPMNVRTDSNQETLTGGLATSAALVEPPNMEKHQTPERIRRNKRKKGSPGQLTAANRKTKEEEEGQSSEEEEEEGNNKEEVEKELEVLEEEVLDGHYNSMKPLMDLADAVETIIRSKKACTVKQETTIRSIMQTAKRHYTRIHLENIKMRNEIGEIKKNLVSTERKEAGKELLEQIDIKMKEYSKDIEGKISEIYKKKEEKERRPTTYAEMTQKGTKPNGADGKTQSINKGYTMLIYPKDHEKITSSEEFKVRLKTKINPTENAINVRRVTSINQNGLAIEFPSEESMSKAKELIAPMAEVREPKKRRPKVLIYDLPRTYTDRDLVKDIYNQSFNGKMERETFEQKFSLKFRTGPKRQGQVNWVAEVWGEVYEMLMDQGRVYLNWESHRVVEYIVATRCYRCQRYGHLSKDCRAEEETCSHCGKEGHSYDKCSQKNMKQTCPNCIRGKKGANHPVNDPQCTYYKLEKEKILKNIDYGRTA